MARGRGVVMNIDFIKWMCDTAEGFETCDNTIVHKSVCFIPINNFYRNDLYPLLLQRAIEGVNKSCTSGERILEVVGMHSQRYLKYGRMCNIIDLGKTDIDKAKESALMYVYEQEKTS